MPIEAEKVERKRRGELSYWLSRRQDEGRLFNGWYERFYTGHFGLTRADYAGKRVLDIGCGPRGSLEWAADASERVGVDPLAGEYLELGASEHGMTYASAPAESIPYADGYFDIVCSFNSLDHVDDLGEAIGEIKRVAGVGGMVLLLTDVHDEPTPQEPVCFGWDVVERFAPELVPQSIRCYEKQRGGMYLSIDQGVMFDHSDQESRYGVLSARFVRVAVHDEAAPPSGADQQTVPAEGGRSRTV